MSLRFNRDLGFLLLGIWLIVTGLLTFIPALRAEAIAYLLALIAIIAGIIFLIRR